MPGLPGPDAKPPKVPMKTMSRNEGRTSALRPVKETVETLAKVEEVEELDDDFDDEWEYQDENDVYLRSKFFESWLWRSVNLPSQAGTDG